MKLQILIPYYQDTYNYLFRLLDSFKQQKNIKFTNFEVLIYNDNLDKTFPIIDTSIFPFSINIYSDGHKGISGARNYLINKATADYIMFCDQDDYFITDIAFDLLFKYTEYNYDVISGPIFIEQSGSSLRLEPSNNTEALNATLLHGRIFKLSHILANNIKFVSKYDGIEDYLFVATALYSAKTNGIYHMPLYIWAFNASSVSHIDSLWFEKKYSDIINCNSDIINYFKNSTFTNKTKIINICILQLLLNCYFTINDQQNYFCSSFLASLSLDNAKLAENIKETLSRYLNEFKFYIIELLTNNLDFVKLSYSTYIKSKNINNARDFLIFYQWILDLLKAYINYDWLIAQDLYPAFSIILPTHNRQAMLYRTIINCLTQNYQKFELIIIDDNSIDNTEAFIKTTFKSEVESGKIKYLKCTTEHSLGASYIRNLGLQAAQNSWIAYLDDDDCPLPNFLAVYADKILLYPETKTFYSTWIWDSLGISNINTEASAKVFNWKTLWQRNFIGTWAFCHHRSLYTELGGFDESIKFGEDWELALRYTLNYPAIAVNKINYYYIDFHSGDSITKIARQTATLYESEQAIRKKYEKYYLESSS